MAKKAIIVQKTIVEIQYVKRSALRLIIIFLLARLSCGLCVSGDAMTIRIFYAEEIVSIICSVGCGSFEGRPYERYHTVSFISKHFICATGSSVEYTLETLRRLSKS